MNPDHIHIERLSEVTNQAAQKLTISANIAPKSQIINFFTKSIKKNQQNLFVAMLENKVVGVIGWYKDNGRWAGKSLGKLFPYGKDIYWISYFVVLDKLRNNGIGSLLMDYLLAELKKFKAKELWTYTRTARRFYEKKNLRYVSKAIIEGYMNDFLKYSFRI